MTNDKNKVLQNLKDADCAPELISNFFYLEDASKKTEQLRLLTRHRQNLLEKLHNNQKQIDCLDYLIFQIKHSSPVKNVK